MELPEDFEKRKRAKTFHPRLFDFFARDTINGGASCPRYFSKRAKENANPFVVELNDSLIKTDQVERLEEHQHRELVFIKANSQIHRNSHERNVSFFNQRFIDAEVYFLELYDVETRNLAGFHPLCKNPKSIHCCGGKDKPSRWRVELWRSLWNEVIEALDPEASAGDGIPPRRSRSARSRLRTAFLRPMESATSDSRRSRRGAPW